MRGTGEGRFSMSAAGGILCELCRGEFVRVLQGRFRVSAAEHECCRVLQLQWCHSARWTPSSAARKPLQEKCSCRKVKKTTRPPQVLSHRFASTCVRAPGGAVVS